MPAAVLVLAGLCGMLAALPAAMFLSEPKHFDI